MEPSSKKIRAAEWVLLMMIAVAPAIFSSFHMSSLASSSTPPPPPTNFYFLFMAVQEGTLLALMVHMLFRQGRRLADIGFVFEGNDIRAALILTAFSFGAALLAYSLTEGIYAWMVHEPLMLLPKNLDFLNGRPGVGLVIFLTVNPFFEELIVRAYTMTEIEFLTGSRLIAVLGSFILQLSYHSYQGPYALVSVLPMTLIFSLYFAKWKRAYPIALAHLIFDLLILWNHPKA